MNKPLCLIIPPSPFLLDERVFMSLGVLKVAASLEKAGVDVDVLDLSGVQNYEEVFQHYVRMSPAARFGFTATTPQMPQAASLTRLLRQIRPDAKTILGGPHPTLTYAAVKKENSRGVKGRAARAMRQLTDVFEVVVCGDGEHAIFEAISDKCLSGVLDADDPKSPLFLTNQTLNDTPFPARHLVDARSYHYQIDGEKALSICCQLGCPFGCNFCGGRNSPMLRRVRLRSTENVVAEIKHLYQVYGIKGIMCYDDELNVNQQMIPLMNAIADLGQELGVEFRLRGFIKSQLFNAEQAQAMYRAGFRWILTGFESGSDRILTNINKMATKEENTRCVAIARSHGLKVKALMSIGHPGESEQTLKETENWLLENRPEDFDITIITPYPGSPYYDDAVFDGNAWVYTVAKTGDKLYAKEVDYFKEADYYKGAPGDYRSYVWTDTLSREALVQERDRLESSVRQALGIKFNPTFPALRFEHSMGQSLPETILKKTKFLTNV